MDCFRSKLQTSSLAIDAVIDIGLVNAFITFYGAINFSVEHVTDIIADAIESPKQTKTGKVKYIILIITTKRNIIR